MPDFLGVMLPTIQQDGGISLGASQAFAGPRLHMCAPPAPLLQILIVTPLNSNTLRVFFPSEPRHVSPLGATDSLNRFNWSVAVTIGLSATPVVEKVENAQAQPTAIQGNSAAWSVDLRLDRPIERRSSYTVTVVNIVSAIGTLLAAPPLNSASCPGDMIPTPRVQPRPIRAQKFVDLAYDSFAGTFVLDSRNDIAVQGGVDYLKKRIIRRVLTRKNGFFHLPGYGAGVSSNMPLKPTDIARLKLVLAREIRREEDVASVAVVFDTTTIPNGIIIQLAVRPRVLPDFVIAFQVPSNGSAILVSDLAAA